ncbi:hypothetical protein ACFP2T_24510 [Plantactinospora solaniradicis]|uniref:Uncharacterized protein n=1 Tax=Plantactinospora solaniradicis TaxID=1723736 RepID=A0ABW1KC31_9ACTN
MTTTSPGDTGVIGHRQARSSAAAVAVAVPSFHLSLFPCWAI